MNGNNRDRQLNNSPFKAAADSEYRYFDIHKLTKRMYFNLAAIDEARAMIADGSIVLKEFRTDYEQGGRGTVLAGRAVAEYFGSVPGASPSRLTIRMTAESITDFRCYVPGCSARQSDSPTGWYSRISVPEEPCAHQIAFLLLLEEYIAKNDPGDATDYSAARMLSIFRDMRAVEKKQSSVTAGREIALQPAIFIDGENINIAFRIGTDRMYVVKDYVPLVAAVDRSGVYPLGKSSRIDFGTDRFNARSSAYFSLIRQIVSEEKQRFGQFYGLDRAQLLEVSRLDIYGSRLDMLFDIFEGKTLPRRDDNTWTGKKDPISFRETDFRPRLFADANFNGNGQLSGIHLRGVLPQMLHGALHSYYMDEDSSTMYRLSQESEAAMSPLMRIGNKSILDMHIGRKQVPEFYREVLPYLRKTADVELRGMENIEEFLPPQVSFRFYMDSVDRIPVCRIAACYGEKEYNPMDLLTEDPSRADSVLSDNSFRDKDSEKSVENTVAEFFPLPNFSDGLYYCTDDDDMVYRAITEGVDRLLSYGEVRATDSFSALKNKSKLQLKVGVSFRSGLLDLNINSEGVSQTELLNILNSYKLKKRYHRLKNGNFVELNTDVAALEEMLNSLQISVKDFAEGNMHIPAYRALYLDKVLEETRDIDAIRDDQFRRLLKDFSTVNEADYHVPPTLQNVLRSYQRLGYKWLRMVAEYGFGCILADDMGLGKTIQVISVLLSDKLEKGRTSALVVCPASLIYNWKEEFTKYAPQIEACVIAGTAAERKAAIESFTSGSCEVLITSYDLLKRDITEYSDILFRYQIIDEAQYIKNHTTAAAKAVKVIRSLHRFALTGTPVENRLSELWSIFDFLMPGYLYGYELFKSAFELPITKFRDPDRLARLNRLVSPFILRRLKSDVLKDLPEKLEESCYAKFGPLQQQLYDAQIIKIKRILEKQSEEEFRKGKLQLLAEITKVRQLCCDPSLLVEDYNGASAKKEACLQLVNSAIDGGHRILIFSQFATMLELLEEQLNESGIGFYKITGATPKEKRLEMVNSFNENGPGTPDVFLISLKAGGTGLNLVGADVVIHYDPWWNVAAQNQATDRAHRIGQERKVTVYKLIAKDTIEEKIVKLQQDKLQLAESVLGGEGPSLSSMNRDEIISLFR